MGRHFVPWFGRGSGLGLGLYPVGLEAWFLRWCRAMGGVTPYRIVRLGLLGAGTLSLVQLSQVRPSFAQTWQVEGEAATPGMYRVTFSQRELVPRGTGQEWLDQGLKAFEQFRLQEALQAFEKAMEYFRQAKDFDLEADALNNIGLVYYTQGQYQKALDHFVSAQTTSDRYEAAIQAGTLTREQNGRSRWMRDRRRMLNSNHGMVYDRLGQYDKALTYYRNAFMGSGRSPSYYGGDGMLLNQIGNVYAKLNQPERALVYYQQALILVDLLGFPLGRDGKTPMVSPPEIQRRVYGWEFQSPKPIDQTSRDRRALFESALSPMEFKAGRLHPWARHLLTITLGNLGEFESRYGSPSQAIRYQIRTIELARLAQLPQLEGMAQKALGDLQRRNQDWDAAQRSYREAIALAQHSQDAALAGLAQDALGELFLQQGQAAAAVLPLQQAIQAWETMRPGLADHYLRSLFETQSKTYQRLQTALIKTDQPRQALRVAEQGRARALVELLARRRSGKAMDPSWSQAPSLDSIQRVARQQQATLVQYSVLPDQLYIWVISPQGQVNFRSVPLKPILNQSSLAQLVQIAREQDVGVRGRGMPLASVTFTEPNPERLALADPATPRTPSTGPFTLPQLRQLHQILIEPIAELLPKNPEDRVIVIPQGELFLVPFVALQDAQGRYLLEQHTLMMAPSIQALALLSDPPAKAPLGNALGNATPTAVLVVGNPTMPRIRLAIDQPPQPLTPLPGAQEEAEAIAKLLGIQPLIGAAARESTIVPKLPRSRWIHLATHGLLDGVVGIDMPGALALAPDGPGSNPSSGDGLLTADEILDLRLQSDLVVLSACDTGRGAITGDGVVGLSRSLLAAGASSVVVSLWAVPDDSTAFLMTELYRQLQIQPDKAKALRAAMLTTLNQFPNLRDWAAFTLVGQS